MLKTASESSKANLYDAVNRPSSSSRWMLTINWICSSDVGGICYLLQYGGFGAVNHAAWLLWPARSRRSVCWAWPQNTIGWSYKGRTGKMI